MSPTPDPYSPCPCASGKKYKFCCRDKEKAAAEAKARAEAEPLLSRRSERSSGQPVRPGDEGPIPIYDEPPAFETPARRAAREQGDPPHRGPAAKLVEFIQPLIAMTDGSPEAAKDCGVLGLCCWNLALRGLDEEAEDREIATIIGMMKTQIPKGEVTSEEMAAAARGLQKRRTKREKARRRELE